MSGNNDDHLLDVVKGLNIYYASFLIVFGTVCNILSIIILSQKTYRGTTFSIYLRFLAIIDLFTLYSGLSRHFILAAFNYHTRDVHEIFCKIHNWTTATSPDLSAWILVAMTVERVVSITKPMKVHDVFSQRNVAIILCFITATLLAMNLPLLINYGDLVVIKQNTTIVKKCKMNKQDMQYFMENIWYWIDLTKFVLLPSFILAILNTVIIFSVVQSRKRIEKYINEPPDNTTLETGRRLLVPQKEASLTATLLVVNITFIILNSPISIYLIGNQYWFDPGFKPKERLIYTCCIMAMYTNNASNFLLYCASGSKFRGEIARLFKFSSTNTNKRGTFSPPTSLSNRQTCVMTITE